MFNNREVSQFTTDGRLLEVGRIIEIDTAIFEKTETDSIFRKTEKYRLS